VRVRRGGRGAQPRHGGVGDRTAGIATAAREARALLDIPGVAGVNISGLASARGYEFAAQVKAELAARIREGGDHGP